jgi:hypothetical protein
LGDLLLDQRSSARSHRLHPAEIRRTLRRQGRRQAPGGSGLRDAALESSRRLQGRLRPGRFSVRCIQSWQLFEQARARLCPCDTRNVSRLQQRVQGSLRFFRLGCRCFATSAQARTLALHELSSIASWLHAADSWCSVLTRSHKESQSSPLANNEASGSARLRSEWS